MSWCRARQPAVPIAHGLTITWHVLEPDTDVRECAGSKDPGRTTQRCGLDRRRVRDQRLLRTGGGGGVCYGPGNERPIEDIIVEVIREDRTDKVLVAEGISAQGQDQSWFLSFGVPNLPPGNYFISAKEGGSTGGGTQLAYEFPLMHLRGPSLTGSPR